MCWGPDSFKAAMYCTWACGMIGCMLQIFRRQAARSTRTLHQLSPELALAAGVVQTLLTQCEPPPCQPYSLLAATCPCTLAAHSRAGYCPPACGCAWVKRWEEDPQSADCVEYLISGIPQTCMGFCVPTQCKLVQRGGQHHPLPTTSLMLLKLHTCCLRAPLRDLGLVPASAYPAASS